MRHWPVMLLALVACGGDDGSSGRVPDAALSSEIDAAAGVPDAPLAGDAPLSADARPADARPADAAAPVDAPRPIDAPPADAGPPAFVTISIDGAVVSPATSTRDYWDGLGSLAQADWNSYLAALGAGDPYGAVLDVIAAVGPSGVERPDPFGDAELFVNDIGGGTVDLIASKEDTFTPQFSGASWTHVKWTSNVRLFVHLSDEDVAVDDTIGYANVARAELEAALLSHEQRHVLVASQSNNQLAFVTVSVTAE